MPDAFPLSPDCCSSHFLRGCPMPYWKACYSLTFFSWDFSGMNSLLLPCSRAKIKGCTKENFTCPPDPQTFSTLPTGTSDWVLHCNALGLLWASRQEQSYKGVVRWQWAWLCFDGSVCDLLMSLFGSECQLLVRISWNEGSINCKLLRLVSNYRIHWEALGRQSSKALKHPLIFKERPLDWDCLCSQTSSEVFVSGPVLSPDYLSTSISFSEVT